ncbi:MAG: hypothetical protein N3E40_02060, partial [Dehalococcoidia bacterium]|nr:hypothetical protein [Dehalococcoidia bacterium]
MTEVNERAKQKLTDKIEFESTRYGKMPLPLKVVFIVATLVGIGLAVAFRFSIKVGDTTLNDIQYYFLLYGLFGGSSFLILPMRRADRTKVPWYDIILALIALAIPVYYFLNAYKIQFVGWVPAPNNLLLSVATVYSLIMLEMARRMGGNIFLGLCVVLYIYPLVASYAPGIFSGASYPFNYVVSFVNFGGEGIRGLPGKVLGEILIG